MWGNLEGRDGGDLGWKINLQPVAFLFLRLEVGADGDEEVIEEVDGIGEDECKCVFYQLHVGALAEVTIGCTAVGVPRRLGHEQALLQGALNQKAVEAGKGRGKGEDGGEVEVGGHQGHQLYRETVEEGGKVIGNRLGSVFIFGKIIKRCHP